MRSAFGRILGLIFVALVIWVGYDLAGPRKSDIRSFDAQQVARLDNAMWRAYYDRRPLPMFNELAELLRRQFHFPLLRSYLAAAYAAKAAFVFKDGKDRGDYERALPDLIRYYQAIRKISVTPFDPVRTAQLELEWWIVHRQRAQHRGGDLERALDEAAAALYQVPEETLVDYGRARATAMDLRDARAERGKVSEQDWQQIGGLLESAWGALWQAVQPGPARAQIGSARPRMEG
jgi:hypothetical protein